MTYPYHPCAEPLAARYERAAPWRPSQAYKSAIQAQTLELYHAIPLTIVRLPEEPCPDMECLARHVAQGVMPVRIRNPHSSHPVLGHFMTEFRVVHDYYGHVVAGNPFGLAGELAAYRQHCQRHYDAWLLPYVWQNVVLENAYFEARGHWPHPAAKSGDPRGCAFCAAPIRYDVEKFGEPRL